jgi:hypothetical protein
VGLNLAISEIDAGYKAIKAREKTALYQRLGMRNKHRGMVASPLSLQ